MFEDRRPLYGSVSDPDWSEFNWVSGSGPNWESGSRPVIIVPQKWEKIPKRSLEGFKKKYRTIVYAIWGILIKNSNFVFFIQYLGLDPHPDRIRILDSATAGIRIRIQQNTWKPDPKHWNMDRVPITTVHFVYPTVVCMGESCMSPR